MAAAIDQKIEILDPTDHTLAPDGSRKSRRQQVKRQEEEEKELLADVMPAPTTTKRVKGVSIERRFIIGSESWNLNETNRPPGIPDDHKKGWRVYVRNVPEGPDITKWLKKVQFKLFHTYKNNMRTFDNPPFEVSETGWGGFTVEIRLFFHPAAHEKPQWRSHFLALEPFGTEAEMAIQTQRNFIRAEAVEIVDFNEPTEGLYDLLSDDQGQWAYLADEKRARAQWEPQNDLGPRLDVPEIYKKNKSMNTVLKDGTPVDAMGVPRSVQLGEISIPGQTYSKDVERRYLKEIEEAEKKLEVQNKETEMKLAAVKKKIAELAATGDLPPPKKK